MHFQKEFIKFVLVLRLLQIASANAQQGANDTIRLGSTVENGTLYPMILLPEQTVFEKILNAETMKEYYRLKNNIFIVYPYAITAATLYYSITTNLNVLEGRKERKQYLKTTDKKLNELFKEQLKNLSVDQGKILVKLIDRQTGRNCFNIIRELKSGFVAIMWQTAGTFFNNSLTHRYDPDGDDKEIENIVRDLEASNLYNYELYQQKMLLSRVEKK